MIGPLFVALFQLASPMQKDAGLAAERGTEKRPMCSPATAPGTLCVWPQSWQALPVILHTTGLGQPGDIPRQAVLLYERLDPIDWNTTIRYARLRFELDRAEPCMKPATRWSVDAEWIDFCSSAAAPPSSWAHGFTSRTILFSAPGVSAPTEPLE